MDKKLKNFIKKYRKYIKIIEAVEFMTEVDEKNSESEYYVELKDKYTTYTFDRRKKSIYYRRLSKEIYRRKLKQSELKFLYNSNKIETKYVLY